MTADKKPEQLVHASKGITITQVAQRGRSMLTAPGAKIRELDGNVLFIFKAAKPETVEFWANLENTYLNKMAKRSLSDWQSRHAEYESGRIVMAEPIPERNEFQIRVSNIGSITTEDYASLGEALKRDLSLVPGLTLVLPDESLTSSATKVKEEDFRQFLEQEAKRNFRGQARRSRIYDDPNQGRQ